MPLLSLRAGAPDQNFDGDNGEWVVPPALNKGSMIAIVSPAGFVSANDVSAAISKLNEWGFTVKVGDTIGRRDGSFGGTDAERAADFQKQLNDPGVSAILCARGGYGMVRIIDSIDFSVLR